MANVDGVQTAKLENGGVRSPGTYNAQVKVLHETYVFPANVFAATDNIKVGTLPAGARVLGAGIRIPVSLGTTGIFDLGTVADPNGFVAGADAGGQAAVKKGSTEAQLGQKFDVATDVYLDCTEATDASEGDVIEAWVEYVVS